MLNIDWNKVAERERLWPEQILVDHLATTN